MCTGRVWAAVFVVIECLLFPLKLLLENAVKHLGAACVWVQARSLSVLIYLLVI